MLDHLTALLPEYLLGAYVVAGLIAAALLGAGIGSTGLTAVTRRARRSVVAARRRAARADAQRRLAEEALDAATHPITSTDDRPETDLEALVRVVMERPAPDPEAWLWDTTPATSEEVDR